MSSVKKSRLSNSFTTFFCTNCSADNLDIIGPYLLSNGNNRGGGRVYRGSIRE